MNLHEHKFTRMKFDVKDDHGLFMVETRFIASCIIWYKYKDTTRDYYGSSKSWIL